MNEVAWNLSLIRFAAIWFFVHAGICFLGLVVLMGISFYVHFENVRELGPAERNLIKKIVSKVKGVKK